ncbi:MAG: hypothetical protein WCL50_00305 [Spirochaetota bacterium]
MPNVETRIRNLELAASSRSLADDDEELALVRRVEELAKMWEAAALREKTPEAAAMATKVRQRADSMAVEWASNGRT